MPVDIDSIPPDELAELAARGHAAALARLEGGAKRTKSTAHKRAAAEDVTPGDDT